MSFKHVLVTGGAGFIGSHLVDAYLKHGCRVTVVDDLSKGLEENVDPRATLLRSRLDAPEVLTRVKGGDFDLISHQAAQLDVRVSVADPAFDAEVNIVASLRLFQSALEGGVKRIIFSSSGGALYGEPVSTPQSEEHPLAPMSPYGCAKLAAEQYLSYFRSVHGVSSARLRYANVYGPRQRSDGEGGVVSIFIRRILRGEAVDINGSGEQTRDFVFVDDVVKANMAASAQIELEGGYNVGTGVETSVNELFAALERIVATGKRPVHHAAKLGEQQRSVLDGSKLRRVASLPAPIDLAEGLEKTIAWFRQRGG